MKILVVRSLLTAILVGPIVTLGFAVANAAAHPIREYQPGISQAEMKAYDHRTVAELEAFFNSRRVQLTRAQSLRLLATYPSSWLGIMKASAAPCLATFLGCMIVGSIKRRRSLIEQSGSV